MSHSADPRDYWAIVSHYENCLAVHGDSHRGVDWPNPDDVPTRYRVMLEVVRRPLKNDVTLLDFGCGTGHLYEHMLRQKVTGVEYAGLDISPKFIDVARAKHPSRSFYCGDVLDSPFAIPAFDYIVLNGVLTEKRELSFDAMWIYAQRLLAEVFAKTRVGMAFNVMSKHVDWEREDLFHLPFDMAAAFARTRLSGHFVFRADYGLREYTMYVYREPSGESNTQQ